MVSQQVQLYNPLTEKKEPWFFSDRMRPIYSRVAAGIIAALRQRKMP
jgi:hypothetical protein